MAIDINEYEKGKAPEILESTGHGPCLVISIYNRDDQTGYMGHIPAPSCNKVWTEFMGVVTNDYQNLSDLEVTLTGRALEICNKEEFDFSLQDRQFVLDDLRERGFKKVKPRFHDGDTVIVTYFDLDTGKVETDESDIYDMLN
jgi:hypothetical protein